MKAAPDSYLVQIHDQQKLDQEQGYGEEPVHVAIGVVERLAGGGDGVLGGGLGDRDKRVRLDEAVEDPHVVVERDQRDKAGDAERGAVAARHQVGVEEEVDGRRLRQDGVVGMGPSWGGGAPGQARGRAGEFTIILAITNDSELYTVE